jgi:cytochrome c oxidase subunit 2
MMGYVEVMEPKDYQNWIETWPTDESQTAQTAVDRGQHLFTSNGCTSCHSSPPQGQGVGPSVKRLSQIFTLADADLIRDEILRPSKHVASGYPDVMPAYQGLLKEDEIFDLITYLTTPKASHD